MVQRCEHCGQTVVATDEQCWHCGKTLSHSKRKAQRVKTPQSATAVSNESASPLPPFSTILLYAGLTAVTLLILIATTHAIGQAPLFLAKSGNFLQAGWQPVTDSQLQFTLDLPQTWFAFELDRAPEAPALRSSPPLQAIRSIFDALVADAQFVFLGTEDTAVFADGEPAFVLVAQSQRLQQLAPDKILDYAQQQLPENVALSTVNQPEEATEEQTAGSFLFNIKQNEALWRCQEQINPSNKAIYLVVTCTSFAQFPRYQSNFEAILHSFQPLGS